MSPPTVVCRTLFRIKVIARAKTVFLLILNIHMITNAWNEISAFMGRSIVVYTSWRIEVSGFNKDSVIKMLQEHSIALNAYAERLFEDERGLDLCPLELVPYFRLQYVDQPAYLEPQ